MGTGTINERPTDAADPVGSPELDRLASFAAIYPQVMLGLLPRVRKVIGDVSIPYAASAFTSARRIGWVAVPP